MSEHVFIENGEIVIRGYDNIFSKEEENTIMMNVINNYPKHQIGEDFNNYLEGLRVAIASALASRATTKINNRKSWNRFPHQVPRFYGQNPMAVLKKKANLKNKFWERAFLPESMNNALYRAQHQVFPVARKTRKNRRKSSRKSRR